MTVRHPMLLANNRIELDPRPTPPAPSVLEVVMLGHCPGTVRWQEVAGNEPMLAEISALGFVEYCGYLRDLLATEPESGQASLYDVPLPIHSLGQFQSLFPRAFDDNTVYGSVLAGKRAWLPLAVQDFFESGRNGQALTLWIIRIDESKGQEGFLPVDDARMTEPATLGAFERALLPINVGIVAMPDLERLQVPAHLPDIPRLRIENPEPVFLPCGTDSDDGHRERRYPEEMPVESGDSESGNPGSAEIAARIARTLARYRPDMQCLLSVPLAAEPGSERPGAQPGFVKAVAGFLDADGAGDNFSDDAFVQAAPMRHMQLVYPYLRGADRKLGSAVGLVAGAQAAVSQQHGPWRSVAGRPLPGRCLPWPPLNQHEASAMRERQGVTVLMYRAGRTVVDDERICVPCLPVVQLWQLTPEQRKGSHWRSAEIVRFMGWLYRQLEALGQKMIFDVDPRDPRPEIALRSFLTRLHVLGALRGTKPEEAFTLTQRIDGESAVIFDIEIAPAYPIDKLRITFKQDRNSGTNTTSFSGEGA